jgi:AcrR family transcriptional regulator
LLLRSRSSIPPKSTRKARGFGHQRRFEILAAAERIFVTSGYEGATIRKIADEVGVSPTALYMHFPDKRAMLMEIGANALGQLTDEATVIAAEPADAACRVRRILGAHMAFALKNQIAYRIVFCEGARELARPAAGGRDLGIDYYQALAGVVGELDEAGRLLTGAKHAVAQVMFTACHGLVSNIILNPNFGYVEVDTLTKAMLDGLIRGHVAEAA